MSNAPRILVAALLSALFASSTIADDSTEVNDIAEFYGFSGVELFKLDGRAFNLVKGDFDNDGLTDIVVVDNRASCLRFFRQLKDGKETQKRSGKFVNKLSSDWRFDTRQISVDKQVAGLVAADFNSDGRTDLAYIGAPDRIVVRYQPEEGKTEWTERWSVRLPDLAPTSWMVASGDLNGDKKSDIAVVGKNATYIIHQGENGKMSSPASLINTSAQLSLVQIADLDGDGRDDLSYQSTEGTNRGLCARLQTKDGRLGPETRFDLRQPRSVTLCDIDEQPGEEILTVDSRTGRVIVSQVKSAEGKDGDLPTRLVQYGVGVGSGREKRAIGIGDIDGDKRNDVVVTDPENAQVLVYRQNGVDGLGTAEKFPGLLGATGICVADIDGDHRAEVIVMSDKEAAIAISRFTEGRLAFPQVVAKPADGFQFAAMAILKAPGHQSLAVVQKKGSGSSASLKLQDYKIEKDGSLAAAGDPLPLASSALGTRGMTLLAMDANQDKADDLLVIPNGSGNKGVILLPTKIRDGNITHSPTEPLNLGISSSGELFEDDGQLYVAREAFARQMSFAGTDWKTADQFNAGESKAKISGVAVLNLDGQDGNEIVLIDTGVRKLRSLRRESGLFKPWKEVDLGSIRFVSSHVADLNGDDKDDLLLFGNQQFSVLYSGNVGSELVEVATYESDRDDAYPADVIAGDINGDGAADLTLIDTSIDGVELLKFDADEGLAAATHFRVFEEKRLVSKANSRGTEPREGIVADVTGDGRADLILLCHDKMIVYPQDPGE